jgi:hypothetical protein
VNVNIDAMRSKLRNFVLLALVAAAALLAGCQSGAVRPGGPLVISEQGYFFVGGRYTTTKDGQISVGQMFVQYQIPEQRRHSYPVIMWHGGGQTGTNFLGTPDGRMGWAEYFLRQGYAVYVVDQPARARSGYFTEVYGGTRRPNTKAMSERFTAPELAKQYPQAPLHTQWPGKGTAGDPVFDQFFASQVEDIADVGVIEQLNRDAGIALLDKIGPAIVLTHSQSGTIRLGACGCAAQAGQGSRGDRAQRSAFLRGGHGRPSGVVQGRRDGPRLGRYPPAAQVRSSRR